MTQPLEESPLHRALVLSNQLQYLPASVVVFSFVVDAVIVTILWLERNNVLTALALALALAIVEALNWALLRRLPQAGRSFGPDQPAALALGAVLTLVSGALGLLGVGLLPTLIVVVLISALAYYATWIEPFRLTLTRQTLAVRNWRGEGLCLRLLHISDLHVERLTARERDLNARIDQLKPDLIVFSGDFVSLSYNQDNRAKQDIRALLKDWHAPLGVFCVPGTPIVEPLTRVLEFVEGLTDLTLLANRWTTVETPCGALHILGLITTHDLNIDRAALAKMMESAPPDGFKLLLTHAPDIAPEAAAAGIDLYLSGHTHGGQIRLPLVGALVSSSQLGGRFVMGRYLLGQMALYVSRGLGMEGLGAPRARFLCPPEIILWEFSSLR